MDKQDQKWVLDTIDKMIIRNNDNMAKLFDAQRKHMDKHFQRQAQESERMNRNIFEMKINMNNFQEQINDINAKIDKMETARTKDNIIVEEVHKNFADSFNKIFDKLGEPEKYTSKKV